VKPPFDIATLQESMQWHKSRDRDPGTVWLRSLLKSVVPQRPTEDPAKPKTRVQQSGYPRAGAPVRADR
jgi:hypothetical protein